MVTLQDHSSTGVNVLSAGVVSGSTGAATTNTLILRQYATDGFSLYFPPGEYYIDSAVRWDGANNVKLWGDGARIYQQSDVSQMFTFANCDKVEVQGLTFHTAYYLARSSASGASVTSPLFAEDCKAINWHHNVVEGFQCHAMRINGCIDISISDNIFRDGHWADIDDNTRDTACVKFWQTASNVKPRDVIVANNQCNTMALVAISGQHSCQKTVIANNSCIARDASDNAITTYQPLAPKGGIEMQYFADASRGYVGADNDDYDQLIITGNNCQGARFSGIGGQSSQRASAVHPGANAIVSNNTIRYCGTSNENNTSNLTGGISWIGYRNLIVSNNFISNIPNDQQQPNGSQAIVIQSIWARVDGSTNTSTPNSCLVEGNIISNCEARGLYITAQNSGSASNGTGDIIVSGNIIQDINNNDFIRVEVPAGTYRTGYVNINNNRLASTKTVGQFILRVELGTTEPAECLIANNDLNFRDATFSTTTRPLIEIFPDRAIVTGNRLIGNAAGIGLNLRASATGQRFDRTIIAENQIHDCEIGVGSNSGSTYGPFLLSNTTLTNCNTNIQHPRSVKHGHWENGKAIMYDDVDPTVGATAPQGTYLAGDSIQNTLANSTGDVMNWYSTGSGGWVPGVQIP